MRFIDKIRERIQDAKFRSWSTPSHLDLYLDSSDSDIENEEIISTGSRELPVYEIDISEPIAPTTSDNPFKCLFDSKYNSELLIAPEDKTKHPKKTRACDEGIPQNAKISASVIPNQLDYDHPLVLPKETVRKIKPKHCGVSHGTSGSYASMYTRIKMGSVLYFHIKDLSSVDIDSEYWRSFIFNVQCEAEKFKDIQRIVIEFDSNNETLNKSIQRVFAYAGDLPSFAFEHKEKLTEINPNIAIEKSTLPMIVMDLQRPLSYTTGVNSDLIPDDIYKLLFKAFTDSSTDNVDPTMTDELNQVMDQVFVQYPYQALNVLKKIIHIGQRHNDCRFDQKASPENIDEVSKSQFMIVQEIRKHPQAVIVDEHFYDTTHFTDLSETLRETIQDAFSNGMPNHFEALDVKQKTLLHDHGASRILLALHEIQSVYGCVRPEVCDAMGRFYQLFDDAHYERGGKKTIKEFSPWVRDIRELEAIHAANQAIITSTINTDEVLIIYGDEHDFRPICDAKGLSHIYIEPSSNITFTEKSISNNKQGTIPGSSDVRTNVAISELVGSSGTPVVAPPATATQKSKIRISAVTSDKTSVKIPARPGTIESALPPEPIAASNNQSREKKKVQFVETSTDSSNPQTQESKKINTTSPIQSERSQLPATSPSAQESTHQKTQLPKAPLTMEERKVTFIQSAAALHEDFKAANSYQKQQQVNTQFRALQEEYFPNGDTRYEFNPETVRQWDTRAVTRFKQAIKMTAQGVVISTVGNITSSVVNKSALDFGASAQQADVMGAVGGVAASTAAARFVLGLIGKGVYFAIGLETLNQAAFYMERHEAETAAGQLGQSLVQIAVDGLQLVLTTIAAPVNTVLSPEGAPKKLEITGIEIVDDAIHFLLPLAWIKRLGNQYAAETTHHLLAMGTHVIKLGTAVQNIVSEDLPGLKKAVDAVIDTVSPSAETSSNESTEAQKTAKNIAQEQTYQAHQQTLATERTARLFHNGLKRNGLNSGVLQTEIPFEYSIFNQPQLINEIQSALWNTVLPSTPASADPASLLAPSQSVLSQVRAAPTHPVPVPTITHHMNSLGYGIAPVNVPFGNWYVPLSLVNMTQGNLINNLSNTSGTSSSLLESKPRYDFLSTSYLRSSLLPERVQREVGFAVSREIGLTCPDAERAYRNAQFFIGNSYNLSYSEFCDIVKASGLVESYSRFHRFSIYGLDRFNEFLDYCGLDWHRGIGGVATESAIIKDLINSPFQAQASQEGLYIAFAEDDLPADWNQMLDLCAESYQMNKNDDEHAFVSIHFNNEGGIYTVLPPALRGTMLEKIITLLDYLMKGFLNGGIFSEDFILNWHQNPNTNEAYLREHLIDLKQYVKNHPEAKALNLHYFSLREALTRLNIAEPKASEDSPYRQPFQTSFRIIGFIEKIERIGNIVRPVYGFRVEYDIEESADFKQFIERYREQHGQYPDYYLSIRQCYESFAEEIKTTFPKMPFARDMFKLLGASTFIKYMQKTMSAMNKEIVFKLRAPNHQAPFPQALPPIPVRYFKRLDISLTMQAVLNKLFNTDRTRWLLDLLNHHQGIRFLDGWRDLRMRF